MFNPSTLVESESAFNPSNLIEDSAGTSSGFSPDNLVDTGEKLGYWSKLKHGLIQGLKSSIPQIAIGAGELMQYAGAYNLKARKEGRFGSAAPFADKDKLNARDEFLINTGEKIVNHTREFMAEHPADFQPLGDTAIDQFSYALGAGVVPLAEAAIVTGITKNPLAAAGLFGSQKAGNTYVRAKEKGMAEDEAIKYATIDGILDTGINAIEFNGLFKPGVRKFLSNFATGFKIGAAAGVTTQLKNNLVDKYALDLDPGYLDNVMLSMGVGGILGGTAHSFASIGKSPQTKAIIPENVKRELDARGIPPEAQTEIQKAAQSLIDNLKNEEIGKHQAENQIKTDLLNKANQATDGQVKVDTDSQLPGKMVDRSPEVLAEEQMIETNIANKINRALSEDNIFRDNFDKQYENDMNELGILPREIAEAEQYLQGLDDSHREASKLNFDESMAKLNAIKDQLRGKGFKAINVPEEIWNDISDRRASLAKAGIVLAKDIPGRPSKGISIERTIQELSADHPEFRDMGESEFLDVLSGLAEGKSKGLVPAAKVSIEDAIKFAIANKMKEAFNMDFNPVDLVDSADIGPGEFKLQQETAALESNAELRAVRARHDRLANMEKVKAEIENKYSRGLLTADQAPLLESVIDTQESLFDKGFSGESNRTFTRPMPEKSTVKYAPPTVIKDLINSLGGTLKAAEVLRGARGRFTTGDKTVKVLKRILGEGYSRLTGEELKSIDINPENLNAFFKLGLIDKDGYITRRYKGIETLENMSTSIGDESIPLFTPEEAKRLSDLIEGQRFTADDSAKVMAHEAGHFIDSIPDSSLERGNIIGHILTAAKGFRKQILSTETGEIKVKNIREELKDATHWWKPFNDQADPSYTKYRYSSKELYADAMSIYLNDPNTARAIMPEFVKGFEQYSNNKPGVKESITELNRIANMSKEEYADWLYTRDAKASNALWDKVLEREVAAKKVQDLNGIDKILMLFARASQPLRKAYAAQTKESQLELITKSKAIAAESQYRYTDSTIQGFGDDLKRIFTGDDGRFLYLHNAKLDDGTPVNLVSEYLKWNRLSKDYKGLAKVAGETQADVESNLQKTVDLTRQLYGEEGVRDLQLVADNFRNFFDDMLVYAKDHGLISADQLESIRKENTAYARIERFIEETPETLMTRGVGDAIQTKTGGVQEIIDPIIASRAQMSKIIRASLKNDFSANLIQESVALGLGKYKEGREGPPTDGYKYKEVSALIDGKKTTAYVRNGVYTYYDFVTSGLNKFTAEDAGGFISKSIRSISQLQKNILIKYNPAFVVRNALRDIQDSQQIIKLYSGFTPEQKAIMTNDFMKEWSGAMKEAFQMEFNGRFSDSINSMLKNGAIMSDKSMFNYEVLLGFEEGGAKKEFVFNEAQKKNIEAKLEQLNSDPKTLQDAAKIINEVLKTVQENKGWKYSGEMISKINAVTERGGKLAAWKTLDKAGITDPKLKARYVKELFGMPDPTSGGIWRPITNAIFLFNGVATKSQERMLYVLQQAIKTEKGLSNAEKAKIVTQQIIKTAGPATIASIVVPFLAKKLYPDDERNPYADVSSADIKGSWVIPTGVKNSRGNYLELKIPRGFIGASLSTMLYNLMDAAWESADLIVKAGTGNSSPVEIEQAINAFGKIIGMPAESLNYSVQNMQFLGKVVLGLALNSNSRGGTVVDPNDSATVKLQKRAGFVVDQLVGGTLPGTVKGKGAALSDFIPVVKEQTGMYEKTKNDPGVRNEMIKQSEWAYEVDKSIAKGEITNGLKNLVEESPAAAGKMAEIEANIRILKQQMPKIRANNTASAMIILAQQINRSNVDPAAKAKLKGEMINRLEKIKDPELKDSITKYLVLKQAL